MPVRSSPSMSVRFSSSILSFQNCAFFGAAFLNLPLPLPLPLPFPFPLPFEKPPFGKSLSLPLSLPLPFGDADDQAEIGPPLLPPAGAALCFSHGFCTAPLELPFGEELLPLKLPLPPMAPLTPLATRPPAIPMMTGGGRGCFGCYLIQ